jgi:hypothetical protein
MMEFTSQEIITLIKYHLNPFHYKFILGYNILT